MTVRQSPVWASQTRICPARQQLASSIPSLAKHSMSCRTERQSTNQMNNRALNWTHCRLTRLPNYSMCNTVTERRFFRPGSSLQCSYEESTWTQQQKVLSAFITILLLFSSAFFFSSKSHILYQINLSFMWSWSDFNITPHQSMICCLKCVWT